MESLPTRDKHAHGVAERSVGNIITIITMLGNITHSCPRHSGPMLSCMHVTAMALAISTR